MDKASAVSVTRFESNLNLYDGRVPKISWTTKRMEMTATERSALLLPQDDRGRPKTIINVVLNHPKEKR